MNNKPFVILDLFISSVSKMKTISLKKSHTSLKIVIGHFDSKLGRALVPVKKYEGLHMNVVTFQFY